MRTGSHGTNPGRARRVLVSAVTTGVLLTACASDSGPAAGSLDAAEARDRLAAACATTATRLDGLTDPIDDAQRPAWTREVAAILDEEADTVRALVLLDEEQRAGFRAFADNTGDQAAGWLEVARVLDVGGDLVDDAELAELTTEIAELSLGRDELADELGVAACRRA